MDLRVQHTEAPNEEEGAAQSYFSRRGRWDSKLVKRHSALGLKGPLWSGWEWMLFPLSRYANQAFLQR